MQKTINEMASYIKGLIPANIPDTYTLKPMFTSISSEDNIRGGVLAFRDFLYQLYDKLIVDGSLYHNPPVKEETGHTSTAGNYPILYNVKSILINIGYHGVLNDKGDALLFSNMESLTISIGPDGGQLRAKISAPKVIESLRFLAGCGMVFNGIDLDAKKPDLSKIDLLEITYPTNSAMLTGLKTMAVAQKELRYTGDDRNDDLFLRCDYRVLQDEETDVTTLLKDFVSPLPAKVQDFALKLHQHYLDAGFKCTANVKYFLVRFAYTYKSHDIWDVAATVNYGYRLFIRAKNTDKYTDVIAKFPLHLQEKIAKGYGCEKKRFGEDCQHGCHGFSFLLDESIQDISHDLETWLDTEWSCLRKR